MIKRKIKIEDDDILRETLVKMYKTSSKNDLCKYGIDIINHVLKFVKFEKSDKLVIDNSIEVMKKFLINDSTINDIRTIAFKIHELARKNSNERFNNMS
ncbi:MAG: hypothetical protein KFW07_03480 [Mycoplasmataceae bacterium]|nr:hypothetical protein [Mycoplasmataceae bacterium]